MREISHPTISTTKLLQLIRYGDDNQESESVPETSSTSDKNIKTLTSSVRAASEIVSKF